MSARALPPGATVGNATDDLGTAAKDDEDNGLASVEQFLHKGFLLTWKTKAGALTVLSAEDGILAHGSNDDVALGGHGKGFTEVGLLATVNFAVLQADEVFHTVVTAVLHYSLHLLGPVTSAAVAQLESFGLTVLESFAKGNDVGVLAVFYLLLPEIAHAGIGVVACHGPNLIGIGSGEEDFK